MSAESSRKHHSFNPVDDISIHRPVYHASFSEYDAELDPDEAALQASVTEFNQQRSEPGRLKLREPSAMKPYLQKIYQDTREIIRYVLSDRALQLVEEWLLQQIKVSDMAPDDIAKKRGYDGIDSLRRNALRNIVLYNLAQYSPESPILEFRRYELEQCVADIVGDLPPNPLRSESMTDTAISDLMRFIIATMLDVLATEEHLTLHSYTQSFGFKSSEDMIAYLFEKEIEFDKNKKPESTVPKVLDVMADGVRCFNIRQFKHDIESQLTAVYSARHLEPDPRKRRDLL